MDTRICRHAEAPLCPGGPLSLQLPDSLPLCPPSQAMSASVPPSSPGGTVNKEGRTALQHPAWKVALVSCPLKAPPVTALTLIWETGKHRGGHLPLAPHPGFGTIRE